MTNPCKRDCPDRSPTCHTECEKYRAYAAEKAAQRARRWEESQVTNALCEGRIRRGGYDPGAR